MKTNWNKLLTCLLTLGSIMLAIVILYRVSKNKEKYLADTCPAGLKNKMQCWRLLPLEGWKLVSGTFYLNKTSTGIYKLSIGTTGVEVGYPNGKIVLKPIKPDNLQKAINEFNKLIIARYG